jgi:hypothetical protein
MHPDSPDCVQGVHCVIPLLVLAAIVTAIWLFDCWNRPYVTCRHCGGEGRDWDSEHEHFGKTHCVWCGENGYRLRWELRLLSVPF